MSSPVIARMSSRSSVGSKHEEELINAYEAEEERIINVLSRKLEQLKEEKIQLENALEAESESHVNRLTRELAALRAQQQQQQLQVIDEVVPPQFASPNPATEMMLDALRRENESLRNRVVDMERDYIRVVRQNEIYREELIDHRRRLGLNADSLVGAGSQILDQPIHRRSSSSPTASMVALPIPSSSRAPMAIPRPPSQIQRAPVQPRPLSPRTPSANTTPLSSGATSPFSPIGPHGHGVTTSSSLATDLTTPPSSTSLNAAGIAATVLGNTPLTALSYPSVPPPSLSSSLGSPVSQYPPRWGHGHSASSRHSSVERGARVAETGSLSRKGSTSVGSTSQTRPIHVPRSSVGVLPVESVPESPVDAVLLS